MVIIISLVVFFNLFSAKVTAQEVSFLDLDPSQVEKVVVALDPYTDLVAEDPELAKQVAEGLSPFFLTKPTVLETQRTPFSYQVQKGDTLSSIANQYDITVATILEANNILADKVLQVGETLTILPETTSTSTEWLKQLHEKQRQQELARQKLRNQLARGSKVVNPRNRRSFVERSDGDFEGEADEFGNPVISSKGITRKLSRFHTGVDIRADVGTGVKAAAAGRVVEITGGWGRGWGASVVVSHGAGVTTRYAHLSKAEVSPGDLVEKGQIIGYAGMSGRSTGPHLHYEMRVKGRAITPPGY